MRPCLECTRGPVVCVRHLGVQVCLERRIIEVACRSYIITSQLRSRLRRLRHAYLEEIVLIGLALLHERQRSVRERNREGVRG